MKVAICGAGLLGLEMASLLLSEGATIKIFGNSLGGKLASLAEGDSVLADRELPLTWKQLTTSWSREIIGSDFDFLSDQRPSGRDFNKHYLAPLKDQLQAYYRPSRVSRVHKRFLGRDEVITGHTRVHDLFRVVYEVDGRESLEIQKQLGAEVFEQMPPEVLKSLSEAYENFEDFDFVVEARGHYNFPLKMGAGGHYGLNEKRISHDGAIFYGLSGLLANNTKSLEGVRRIALIGSGEVSALILTHLRGWFESDKSRELILITTERGPFANFVASDGDTPLSREVVDFLRQRNVELEQQIEKFEREMGQWKSLEPHIRAKMPRPDEPRGRFQVFTGVNVTSVDRLDDREGIFLTLEAPSFRESNLSAAVRTFSCERAFVATGHAQKESLSGLPELPNCKEEGHYHLDSGLNQIPKEHEKMKNIFNDMTKYFTKVES